MRLAGQGGWALSMGIPKSVHGKVLWVVWSSSYEAVQEEVNDFLYGRVLLFVHSYLVIDGVASLVTEQLYEELFDVRPHI